MGQMNRLRWSMEVSDENGASGEEELGWRREGGMC